MDLHHRHAPIPTGWNVLLSGGLDTFGFGETEKMPDRIFDIIRVHFLMSLELTAALLKPAGVVIGDASLPMIGIFLGKDLEKPVKICDGRLDPAQLELFPSTPLIEFALIWH